MSTRHKRFPWVEFIEQLVREEGKVDDGLLHPSTHLGCEIAMCHSMDPDVPVIESDYENLMRLMTGTLWHAFIERKLKEGEWEGYQFVSEAPATPGLPKGWAGTRDVLIGCLSSDRVEDPVPWWTLTDFKTIAGSGLPYLDIETPKPEHQWQASAYYWSAVEEGYRMTPELCIVHIPISKPPYGCKIPALPIEQWFEPLPKAEVYGEMKRRSRVLAAYLDAKKSGGVYEDDSLRPKEMEKVEKTKFDRKLGQTVVTSEPSWLVRYCKSGYCACKGQTKDVVAYLDPEETANQGSL